MAIQLRLCYSQSLKPCELQKPIPNHQISFCLIYLLLLTLSIIRSSCPPSHQWTSLWFHFAGLFRSVRIPFSLISLLGWPGEGRYPQNINWSLGFPKDRFLDPYSSPHTLHHWVPSYRHMASPTIATLMTHSSISLFIQMIQRKLHGSQAAWQTSWHGWKNITYSSTWQRLRFLSSLPLQLYSMTSRFSKVHQQLPHQLRSEILV